MGQETFRCGTSNARQGAYDLTGIAADLFGQSPVGRACVEQELIRYVNQTQGNYAQNFRPLTADYYDYHQGPNRSFVQDGRFSANQNFISPDMQRYLEQQKQLCDQQLRVYFEERKQYYDELLRQQYHQAVQQHCNQRTMYYDQRTGQSYDPRVRQNYQPQEQLYYDVQTGQYYDLRTGQRYDARTRQGCNQQQQQQWAYDARSGNYYDTRTGEIFNPRGQHCDTRQRNCNQPWAYPQPGRQSCQPSEGCRPHPYYYIDSRTMQCYDSRNGQPIRPQYNQAYYDPNTGRCYTLRQQQQTTRNSHCHNEQQYYQNHWPQQTTCNPGWGRQNNNNIGGQILTAVGMNFLNQAINGGRSCGYNSYRNYHPGYGGGYYNRGGYGGGSILNQVIGQVIRGRCR